MRQLQASIRQSRNHSRPQEGSGRLERQLRRRVAQLEARLQRIEQARPGSDEAPAIDYVSFEHEFRGSRQDVTRRLRAYLELFQGRGNVLDLGCGRGEFVEILSSAGLDVLGVDRSPAMIAFCLDRGLQVVCADAFGYLADVPDASVGGISAFQLIEHLHPSQIVQLVGLCGSKLQPGGVLVLETVNPMCAMALGNFYLDPTHVRPVPAPLLHFIARQAGLHVDAVRFSAPVPGCEAPPALEVAAGFPPDACLYQDYAVIATRCAA